MHLRLFWTLFKQMPKLFFKNLPQNSKCQTLNLNMLLANYWCCHRLKEDMLTQTESKLIYNAAYTKSLGIPEVNRCVVTSTLAKTGRCYACVKDLFGINLYKERREKLNTRVKTSCSICNALICKQHTQLVCAKCNNR